VIELWPGSMAGIRFLRGLSLLVRYQYGLNKQKVTAAGLMNDTNTFWQSTEVSLRHRWTSRSGSPPSSAAATPANQYQFEGFPTDVREGPRRGLQGVSARRAISLLLPFEKGLVEPFLTFENRVIQSGGLLATKFDEARPSGFRASAGVAARFGKITARVEGRGDPVQLGARCRPDVDPQASSASDAIRAIGFSVGYEY